MKWRNVLPDPVAKAQETWDRQRAALRMRDLGMTYREIGARFGVTHESARHLALSADRRRKDGWRSPIERYFAEVGDLRRLAGMTVTGTIRVPFFLYFGMRAALLAAREALGGQTDQHQETVRRIDAVLTHIAPPQSNATPDQENSTR